MMSRSERGQDHLPYHEAMGVHVDLALEFLPNSDVTLNTVKLLVRKVGLPPLLVTGNDNWLHSKQQKNGEHSGCSPLSLKVARASSPVNRALDARATNQLEGKLAAQLNSAAAKVARAVVVKERTGYIGKGKGHRAYPELVGTVKVVLLHEER